MVVGGNGAQQARHDETLLSWLRVESREHPAVHVDPEPLFVQDGPIWTSAGVTAGIDLALRLAELLTDEVTAKAMQLAMEYDPQPPFDAGSVAKAGPLVLARAQELARLKD